MLTITLQELGLFQLVAHLKATSIFLAKSGMQDAGERVHLHRALEAAARMIDYDWESENQAHIVRALTLGPASQETNPLLRILSH